MDRIWPKHAGGAGGDDEDAGWRAENAAHSQQHPDLNIIIEVWNGADDDVEQVIAITSSRSIGFAAYYAAKDQFPQRTIVMRDRFGEISRWPARKI